MPLRGLLLDLWGTLFYPSVSLEEYMRYRARLLWEKLNEFGYSEEEVYDALVKSRSLCDTIRDLTMREITAEMEVVVLLRELGIFDKVTKNLILKLAEVYMRPYLELTRPLKGIKRLFEETIRMEIKIAIVSNTMKGDSTRRLMEKHGLDRYVNTYVLSDEVCYRKPHPAIFRIALRKLSVSPSQAIMIGDEEGDIRGANNLGIKAILFSGFKKERVRGDYEEASSTEELVNLIKKYANESISHESNRTKNQSE